MTNDILEICDDVKEECGKFGEVVEVKIPRPISGSRQSPGVGKIFVKFATTEQTTKALKALAGRKFSDRTVVTTYFPEVGTPHQNPSIFDHVDCCLHISRRTLKLMPGKVRQMEEGMYAKATVLVQVLQ
jgi:RNA recognition motif-containing protein